MANKNPNLNKRKKDTDDDTDSDSEYIQRYNKKRDDILKTKLHFPRFLMMMSGDDEKSLSRLSTFAIQKGIQGLVGEPKYIKRLRSGDLLIEVDRESHSTKILAITELANVPVKVTPHRTLNTSKGVIRSYELKNTTADELTSQLKKQGVTHARLVTIKKNGAVITLNTAILTFNRPTPPATLKVGFERCPVQLFVPSPLRCFKCQQFGHHQDNCKRTKVCGRCAQADHQDSACTNEIKCANCNAKHTAYSKDCPRWIKEKEIQRVRTEQKISFPEARKIVEGVTRLPSFASVVAKQVVSVGCQTDPVVISSAAGAAKFVTASATPSKTSKTTSTNTATTNNIAKAAQAPNLSVKSKVQSNVANVKQKEGKPTPPPKPKPIIKPSNMTEKSNTKQHHLTSKPKTTNAGIGRMSKGMDNPISVHNRFEAMDGVQDEDDSENVFVSSDTVTTLLQQFKKADKAKDKPDG